MFEGLNAQVFNTPVDLFIEDLIYNRYEAFRPLQFISLYTLTQDSIKATTGSNAESAIPPKILSLSKTYSLVNTLHLKTLFGLDFIPDFRATRSELLRAQQMYDEFLEYREDKQPGEEYELIQNQAEDLGLDAYFELISETDYRGTETADTIPDSIEADPYGLNTEDPEKEREMKTFFAKHASGEINTAVAMYMVGAIQYLNRLPKEKVKELAFEIAHVGIAGIDPAKDGYRIPSIKGSSFTGYQTLAWYYASWAIALPEMLGKLQMPFAQEYRLAGVEWTPKTGQFIKRFLPKFAGLFQMLPGCRLQDKNGTLSGYKIQLYIQILRSVSY